MHRPRHPHALLLAISLTACGGGEGLGRDFLDGRVPDWQRIEPLELPEAWRLEEASFAFDAWQGAAEVASLEATDEVTTIRFDDGAGGAMEVRIAPLPVGRFPSVLAAGDRVRIELIRRVGFEGVAQGLIVVDEGGLLQLLYDDGGYGPAYYQDVEREGIGVARELTGPTTRDRWERRDVTVSLTGDTVTVQERESAPLGDTGLAVTVLVSREWTGAPPTDIDLTPLAYLVHRYR